MSAACGTYARYSSHHDPCRCEACRKAKADYVRERRRAGVEPPRSSEFSVPAWNQTVRGRGAQKKRAGVSRVLLPNLRVHGTPNGYRRGCRCWPCTDAATAKTARQRLARRAAA